METDAKALARSYRHDPELAKSLPRRPCLVPGLLTVPLNEDSLIVTGGFKRVLFTGKSARGHLLELLPALDGTRTVEDLAQSFAHLSEDTAFEVLCLLHSNGLTMEGPDRSASPLGTFAARFVGYSRQHTDGEAARERLARTRLLLICSETCRRVIEPELVELGFGTVTWESSASPSAKAADHDVALVIAPSEDAEARLRECWVADLTAFRIGVEDRLEIGPLILPRRSACFTCVREQIADNVVEPSPGWDGMALAVHRFAMTWSLIANNEFHNTVILQDRDGDHSVRQKIIRRPGCGTCGLGLDVSGREELDEVLLTHFRAEIAPKEFLSPSYHMAHYSAKNIDHTKQKPTLNPAITHVPFASSALEQDFGRDHWLPRFGQLLELCFGYRAEEVPGYSIRYVPSGGGLDSPTPYVVLQDIPGIADGVYRYSPDALALEQVPSLTGGQAFFDGTPGPKAFLVVLAAQSRISVKYLASSTRICCLDAGVSLLNVVGTARALEIPAHVSAAMDNAGVLKELNMPRAVPAAFFPTYAAAFGHGVRLPAMLRPSERDLQAEYFDKVTLPSLGSAPELLIEEFRPEDKAFVTNAKSRRTWRVFAPVPVAKELVDTLLTQVVRQIAPLPLAGCNIEFLVYITRDGPGLPSGLYSFSPESLQLMPLGSTSLAPREFLNQTSLSQAPVLIFVTADLLKAAADCGFAGYRNALTLAGAAAGALWNQATGLDLVGCVAGGLIESATRFDGWIDGYTRAPLVAFVTGHRSSVA